jgi:hypothetical protein
MQPQEIVQQLAWERFKRQLALMPTDEKAILCETVAKRVAEDVDRFKRRLLTDYHFSTRQRRQAARKRARLAAETISFYGPRRQVPVSRVRDERSVSSPVTLGTGSHGSPDLTRGYDPWHTATTTAA